MGSRQKRPCYFRCALVSYSPSATCPELWHCSSIPLGPRAVLPSPVDKGGFHLYAGFACHGNAGKLINEHSTKVMRAADNHLSAPARSLQLANSSKRPIRLSIG